MCLLKWPLTRWLWVLHTFYLLICSFVFKSLFLFPHISHSFSHHVHISRHSNIFHVCIFAYLYSYKFYVVVLYTWTFIWVILCSVPHSLCYFFHWALWFRYSSNLLSHSDLDEYCCKETQAVPHHILPLLSL